MLLVLGTFPILTAHVYVLIMMIIFFFLKNFWILSKIVGFFVFDTKSGYSFQLMLIIIEYYKSYIVKCIKQIFYVKNGWFILCYLIFGSFNKRRFVLIIKFELGILTDLNLIRAFKKCVCKKENQLRYVYHYFF